MTTVILSSVFEEAHPETGASEAEINYLIESVKRPLSNTEVEQICRERQRIGLPQSDPSRWSLPGSPLPAQYLEFLRWSNGGAFRNGERWFDSFFHTAEVRSYLLAYDLPQYMPGVIPFAFDGSGTFYVFDMREASIAGEYPVLIAAAGNLGFSDCRKIASSFLEACRGDVDPLRLLCGSIRANLE
jgi:hypothetical protein